MFFSVSVFTIFTMFVYKTIYPLSFLRLIAFILKKNNNNTKAIIIYFIIFIKIEWFLKLDEMLFKIEFLSGEVLFHN